MLSIFLIGIALSMDAYSVALSIGTTNLKKNRYYIMNSFTPIHLAPEMEIFLKVKISKVHSR